MKEKMTGMRWVEKMYWVLWKVLPTTALLCALRWTPTEWFAQKISGVTDGALTTDVVKKDAIHSKITMMPSSWIEVQSDDWPWIEPKPELWEDDDTIDLWPLARWTPVKAPDKWLRELDEDQKEPEITGPRWDEIKIPWEIVSEDEGLWEKKEPRISASGFLQVWTSIVPDFASICSDKPSMLLFVDATDSKSWLWLSYIRLDDFHKDPDYPVSRASVLVPHRSKTLWDGKRTVWASVECTYVDNSPEMSELLPLVVWSYTTKSWWTFEWKYFHEIMKWPDADAFRLWITKKIWDALSLTAHWWYKSDYDDKFFGRVVADIDIWNGLWVQVSWVIKDGKISPTAWVIYKF
jgi:hypothetical protein